MTCPLAALAALTTALFLSSCSTSASDSHADHPQTDQPVITGQPAGYNADDVAFATNMIPHHQQAVDLSAMVPDRSTNAGLVALADQISAAQQPEINVMKVFLVQWNENPDTNSGHAGHGSTTQGMVDAATMTKLESLNGEEFDELWLAVDDQPSPGRDRDGQGRDRQRRQCGRQDAGQQHRHHAGSRDRPDEADAGRLK